MASRDVVSFCRDEERAYRSRERWPQEMWFIVVGMKEKRLYREKGGLEESTRTSHGMEKGFIDLEKGGLEESTRPPHGTLNIVPNRPSTIHNVNLLLLNECYFLSRLTYHKMPANNECNVGLVVASCCHVELHLCKNFRAMSEMTTRVVRGGGGGAWLTCSFYRLAVNFI